MIHDLVEAIILGNFQEVIRLLKSPDVNVNYKTNSNQSLLTIAVAKGDLNITALLLSQPEINVDALDEYQQTPIMIAADNKSIQMLELLIPHSNLALKDGQKKTAFDRVKKQMETTPFKSEAHEYRNILNLLCNPTMLSAAQHGDMPLLKIMLHNEGADVNAHNDIGQTALMLAVKAGMFDIAEYLMISPRVQIDVKDQKAETALLHCLRVPPPPLDPQQKEYYNECLDIRLKIARILVAFGANANQRYADGTELTAFTAAAKWYSERGQAYLDLLASMIENKADLTVPCPKQQEHNVNDKATGTVLDIIQDSPREVRASLKNLIEPTFIKQLAKKNAASQTVPEGKKRLSLTQSQVNQTSFFLPLKKSNSHGNLQSMSTLSESTSATENDKSPQKSQINQKPDVEYAAKSGYRVYGMSVIAIPRSIEGRAELAIHVAIKLLMSVKLDSQVHKIELAGAHAPLIARAIKSFDIKDTKIQLPDSVTIPNVSFLNRANDEAKIIHHLAHALKPALKTFRTNNWQLADGDIEQLITSARSKKGKQTSHLEIKDQDEMTQVEKRMSDLN